MNNIRIIAIVASALLLCSCNQTQQDLGRKKVKSIDNTSAITIGRSIGLGWNLGNQFDAFFDGVSSETAWGNATCTEQIFKAVKAAGFNSVRIPITWLGHFGEAPDYKIEENWIARIEEVVGWAEDAGLHVIINIHHDGADSNNWLSIREAAHDKSKNEIIKNHIAAIWRQIAERFKDRGDFLIFEAFNEIHDGGWGWGENRNDSGQQYAMLNEWLQTFVNTVRATGSNNANRYLGIPGYVTNIDLTINNLILPTDIADDRLLVAVHYYDPVDFTLNANFSQWGCNADSTQKASYGDEQHLKNEFARLKEKYIDNNIGVYIGEFGCVHRESEVQEAYRRYYVEYLCHCAYNNGISAFYWDNGYAGTGKEQSGLFDRTTNEYANEDARMIVEAMVRGYSDEDDK